MLSQGLLARTLGVDAKSVRVEDVDLIEVNVEIRLRPRIKHRWRCPHCQSRWPRLRPGPRASLAGPRLRTNQGLRRRARSSGELLRARRGGRGGSLGATWGSAHARLRAARCLVRGRDVLHGRQSITALHVTHHWPDHREGRGRSRRRRTARGRDAHRHRRDLLPAALSLLARSGRSRSPTTDSRGQRSQRQFPRWFL